MERRHLAREVSRDWREAMELLPAVGDTIDKVEIQEKEMVNVHKMNAGLARIEDLLWERKTEAILEGHVDRSGQDF